MVNAQLDAIDKQMKLLQVSRSEHIQAKETLVSYKKLKKNHEILVPIGADSYVFANVSDSSKVIIGIGADVSTERSIDEGIQKLDERAKMIEESERKLAESMRGLQQQATALNSRIQELYEAIQAKGQQ
jgi:prefoldin alpha subunit